MWVIDIDDEVIEAQSRTPLAVPAAENMAYVIYTSGTTGAQGRGDRASERDVAGGVAGCRAASRAQRGRSAIHAGVRLLGVGDLGALLSGRRLLVVPGTWRPTPEELHNLLVDEQVSVLTQTPSAVAMLATEQLESMTLVVAGEACPPELVERWAAPGRTMIDAYGPTEATVCASMSTPLRPGRAVVPVGSPIEGAATFVLDPWLQPVAPGVVGELYLVNRGVGWAICTARV